MLSNKQIMDIFKGQELIEFSKRFQSELDCKKYLAEIKWKAGFTCRKCGHHGSQIRKDYARTCNKCSDTESAGAGTLFHKVKFGLVKAFYICFEMSTSTKSLSAMYMAKRYGINRKTAMSFMHKVREAMKSSGNHPMKGEVHVDEFVVGGQEAGHTGRSYGGKKEKVVCAVELTEAGKANGCMHYRSRISRPNHYVPSLRATSTSKPKFKQTSGKGIVLSKKTLPSNRPPVNWA